MEGRYVTVFHEEEQDASTEIVTLKIYSVTVFTEMIYYGKQTFLRRHYDNSFHSIRK